MITLRSRRGQENHQILDLTLPRLHTQYMRRNSLKIAFFSLVMGTTFSIHLFALPAHAKAVTAFVKKEEEIREQMIAISRQLGVTCTECHKVTDFKDASKIGFKTGLEHIRLTEMLKNQGLDGKKGTEATCYMCHRGQLVPDYKEPETSASSTAH